MESNTATDRRPCPVCSRLVVLSPDGQTFLGHGKYSMTLGSKAPIKLKACPMSGKPVPEVSR